MKNSWATNKITINIHSINESNNERELLNVLQERINGITKETIKIDGKWFYPDVVIGKFIVEYYGDFWHANPEKYKECDFTHHNIQAKEIWERDADRVKRLNDGGYFVVIVWEKDYKNNKKNVVDNIINLYDEWSKEQQPGVATVVLN